MSQENVQVVQRWLWAFENDTDKFRETLHPEIEWFPFEERHTRSYGVDDAMRIRNEWLDSWEEHRLEPEEFLDAGDGVVVVLHITARGRTSGAEVDVRLYPHLKVRDGRVIYLFEYEEKAPALEAVGLSE